MQNAYQLAYHICDVYGIVPKTVCLRGIFDANAHGGARAWIVVLYVFVLA